MLVGDLLPGDVVLRWSLMVMGDVVSSLIVVSVNKRMGYTGAQTVVINAIAAYSHAKMSFHSRWCEYGEPIESVWPSYDGYAVIRAGREVT